MKQFFLRDQNIKRLALAFVANLPVDQDSPLVVKITEMVKTREQEEKYHAMIGDIAKQYKLYGRYWDEESMKRLLVDQFYRDTRHDDDLKDLWQHMGGIQNVPSIDGTGVVSLGAQTRKFPKRLAIAFITWLDAFAAENGVEFERMSA